MLGGAPYLLVSCAPLGDRAVHTILETCHGSQANICWRCEMSGNCRHRPHLPWHAGLAAKPGTSLGISCDLDVCFLLLPSKFFSLNFIASVLSFEDPS